MQTNQLFESIERHIPLTDEQKELIGSFLTGRTVMKNQFLVREGTVCRCTNFVNVGSLRTYFVDLGGQEHTVQFAIEGWWICDLESFALQTPATFNVQAIEDSEVLELTFESLELIFDKVPKMERYFRVITQHAFISFQQRTSQNISMEAEDRYLAFRQKYPRIELRIPDKLAASYLAISTELLAEIKKRLMDVRKNA